MTISELLDQLRKTSEKLKAANISDGTRDDLEDLISETKREIVNRSVDPLKEINEMPAIDVSQLKTLSDQLEQDIQNEQKRMALVGKIIGIAKGGLRAGGLPLPF
jgi:hypothetical protein